MCAGGMCARWRQSRARPEPCFSSKELTLHDYFAGISFPDMLKLNFSTETMCHTYISAFFVSDILGFVSECGYCLVLNMYLV